MRVASLTLLLAGSLALSGCSGSPFMSPTPISAIIAGNWSGTEESTPPGGGQRQTLAATATFTQNGDDVTGQITLAGGAVVMLAGTMFGSSVTFDVEYVAGPPQGQACTGTARVSGSASDTTLRFSVQTLATTAPCVFSSSISYVLERI